MSKEQRQDDIVDARFEVYRSTRAQLNELAARLDIPRTKMILRAIEQVHGVQFMDA